MECYLYQLSSLCTAVFFNEEKLLAQSVRGSLWVVIKSNLQVGLLSGQKGEGVDIKRAPLLRVGQSMVTMDKTKDRWCYICVVGGGQDPSSSRA
jgi:hypothetical protein